MLFYILIVEGDEVTVTYDILVSMVGMCSALLAVYVAVICLF